MSLRGSPVHWWKEKRQSSHSGIPPSTRPQTPFPWNEDRSDQKKLIEEAVLAAFESDAFKLAVASQVEPPFTRNHEKLKQLKVTSLNLESALQSQFEDVNSFIKPVQDHLAALEVHDYEPELKRIGARLEKLESRLEDLNIPDHGKDLADIASGQARLMKLIENQFNAFESRIDELDRKIDGLDETVVNSDLRSALRFGELSNELQDRNSTLGDRIWEVEREMGRKMDVQQRKVVVACEEVGKSVRSTGDVLESMQTKLDSDEVLSAVNKVVSKVEMSEKALRRDVVDVQEKLSNIDTSAIPSHTRKLETILRAVSDVKKDLEVQGNLASLDSKLLSTNTARLDGIVSTAGQIRILGENTERLCQDLAKSQDDDAAVIKENGKEVLSQLKSLQASASSQLERTERSISKTENVDELLVALDAALVGKMDKVESRIARIDEDVLASHASSLHDIVLVVRGVHGDLKPQTALLHEIRATLSDTKSGIESKLAKIDEDVFASHTSSLNDLALQIKSVNNELKPQTTSLHEIGSRLSDVKLGIDAIGPFQAEWMNGMQTTLLNEFESKISDLKTSLDTSLTAQSDSINGMQASVTDVLRSKISDLKTDVGATQAAHTETLSILQNRVSDTSTLVKMQSSISNLLTQIDTTLLDMKSGIETTATTRAESLNGMQMSLHEVSSKVSELRTDVVATQTTHTASLDAIQEHISDTSVLDVIQSEVSALSSYIDQKLASSLDSVRCDIGELSDAIDQVTNQASTHNEHLKSDVKSLLESSTATHETLSRKHQELLAAIAEANSLASKKDDLDTAYDNLLQAIQQNGALVKDVSKREHVENLQTKLDGMATVLESKFSSMNNGIQSTTISTQAAITGQLTDLDKKLQSHLEAAASRDAEHTESLHAPIKEVLEEVRGSHATSTSQLADLEKKLQSRFDTAASTATEQTQSLRGPIKEILDEVRGNRAFLEAEKADIRVEFQSTRGAIEASMEANATANTSVIELLQEIREASKDAEVLESLECWGQKHVVRQDETSEQIKQLLQAETDRDDTLEKSLNDIREKIMSTSDYLRSGDFNSSTLQELALIKAILADDHKLSSVEDTVSKTRDSVDLLHNHVNKLQHDGTARNNALRKSVNDVEDKTTSMLDCLHSGDLKVSDTLRELGDIKSILEDNRELSLIKAVTINTRDSVDTIQADVKHMKEDVTIRSIKQLLLQNASSMATAYEGILAIDTKIKSSEDLIHSTIQDKHTALSQDILDAVSTITNSVGDDMTDLKADLSSRISTSTNVLRSEVKAIDFSPATVALESLRGNIESTLEAAHTKTKALIEDLQSSLQFSDNSLAQIVKDASKDHTKSSEQTAAGLGQLSKSLSKSLLDVQQDLRPFGEDIKAIVLSLEGVDKTTKSSLFGLSTMEGTLNSRLADSQKVLEAQKSTLTTFQQDLRPIGKDIKAISESLEGIDRTTKSSLSEVSAMKDTLTSLSADGQKVSEAQTLMLSTVQQDLRPIGEGIKALSGAVDEVNRNTTSSLTRLSTIEGTLGSQIADSQKQAQEAQTSILTAIQGHASGLQKVEDVLRDVDETRKQRLESIEQNIIVSVKSVTRETAELQATIIHEIGATKADIMANTDGIKVRVEEVAAEMDKAHDSRKQGLESIEQGIAASRKSASKETADLKSYIVDVIDATKADIKGNVDDITIKVEEITANMDRAHESNEQGLESIEQSILTSRKSAAQDTADLKSVIVQELGASKKEMISNIGGIRIKVEEVSADIDRAHEATVAIIKSESKAVSEAVQRESRNTIETVDAAKQSVVSEYSNSTSTITLSMNVMQTSILGSLDTISTSVTKGFGQTSTDLRESRKTTETSVAALSETVRNESQSTLGSLESSQNRIISEMQKISTPLRSSLNGLKSDINSISSDLHISESAIRNDIKSLDSKTVSRITGIETSLEDHKNDIQSSFANITSSVKAIDAAVRVNSAAIARVDNRVLESGSQIKSVVVDGNREVLFQLDEELHESGTRIRGISEFDIPKLEALSKRNMDALEVIGARVIGTTKKFDEAVTQHGKKEKSMEVSDILNGRLRGGSNASSRGSLRMSTPMD